MKNHKEIIQKTDEWYEIKWGKIGGTLSSGLHVKGDTLFIDLLSQHIEDVEIPDEPYESAAMMRGNRMEDEALEYISNVTKIKFEKTGWLQCEKNKLLGISPDGISEDETIMCELKCLGRKEHLKILLNNDIHIDHIDQCAHYFLVNPKLEILHYLAYRPESKKHFYKVLTLDSLINTGTNAKPVLLPIRDFVSEKRRLANGLFLRIESELEKMKNDF